MTNTTIQQNKATQIENYFVDNPYVEFTTTDLHARFGPSFRSRVSEINRNPKRKVTIKNRTSNRRVYQSSVYWGEPQPCTCAPGVAEHYKECPYS